MEPKEVQQQSIKIMVLFLTIEERTLFRVPIVMIKGTTVVPQQTLNGEYNNVPNSQSRFEFRTIGYVDRNNSRYKAHYKCGGVV